eukprot:393144_1
MGIMLKERLSDYKQYIPILHWLPNYSIKNALIYDIYGGISVGIMAIPQCMAYATLAGLSPIAGLNVAFIAPLLYTVFGTSGQVHVAPVALTAIMSSDAITQHLSAQNSNDPSYDLKFAYLSSMIALQVGIIQLILGWFKIGALCANMLSE